MTYNTKPISLAFLFFFMSSITVLAGSSILDKKITLHVQNEPLHEVLHEIEQLAGVNFAYMSGLIDKNKPVHITATNEALKSILQKLITNPDVLLYVIDNKIIFYKKDQPPPGSEGTTVALTPYVPKPPSTEKIMQITRDTVIDTLRVTIYDTIQHVCLDTIKVYDTVRIAQTATNGTDSTTQNGWSITVHYSFFSNSESISPSKRASLVMDKETIENNTAYSLSAEYAINRWRLSLGVGRTSLSWNADYNQVKQYTDSTRIAGYDVTQTWQYNMVDEYYTFSRSRQDSSLVQIFDSTMVETKKPVYARDSLVAKYKGRNTAKYSLLQFSASYSYPVMKKLDAMAQVGATLYLLTNASGQTLVNDSTLSLVDFRSTLKDYVVATNIAAGVRYHIAEKVALEAIISKDIYVSDMFRYDYPAGRKLSRWAYSLGVQLKL